MAKILSPSGTVCTAEGELLEKLLASGWKAQEAPKPAATRKSTKKE